MVGEVRRIREVGRMGGGIERQKGVRGRDEERWEEGRGRRGRMGGGTLRGRGSFWAIARAREGHGRDPAWMRREKN